MKINVTLIILCTFLFSCKSYKSTIVDSKTNIDNDLVHHNIAYLLNKMLPKFKSHYDINKFYVDKQGRPRSFFVWDLVDTLNVVKNYDSPKFVFKKNTIYHFAPRQYNFFVSNFLYIDEYNNQHYFFALNCNDKGNTIDEVITFIKEKEKNNPNLEKIITNIKSYKEFRIYLKFSYESRFDCDELKLKKIEKLNNIITSKK